MGLCNSIPLHLTGADEQVFVWVAGAYFFLLDSAGIDALGLCCIVYFNVALSDHTIFPLATASAVCSQSISLTKIYMFIHLESAQYVKNVGLFLCEPDLLCWR